MARNSNQNDKLHSPSNMRATMELTLASTLKISRDTAQQWLIEYGYDMEATITAIQAARADGTF